MRDQTHESASALSRLKFWPGKRLPVVLQAEAAECGLACLAMVSSYHGAQYDLRQVREKLGASLRGVSLRRLMEMATAMSLSARALRIELDALRLLKVPAILHWDMDHFVVLKEVRRTHLLIHDPAVGAKKVPLSEASSHFTGVALEITPAAGFQPVDGRRKVSLREITGGVKGLLPELASLLALSLVLQLLVLLAPLYMQLTLDHALVAGDRSLLTVLALGFICLAGFQVVVSAIRSWSVAYLSSSVGIQWNINVFSHLVRLPVNWFIKRHLGDVISRLSSTQAIQRTLTTSVVEAILDGLMAVMTLTLMLLYNAYLALFSIAAVALYAVARVATYQTLRNASEEQLVSSAKQQSHLLESVRGLQSVRLNSGEHSRRSGYQSLMIDSTNRDLRLARLGIAFGACSSGIFSLERVVVIWVGALAVLDSVMSVGMLIAFLAYKDQFAGRMNALIDRFIEFRMLRLHCDRLSDIVLADTEPSLSRPARDLPLDDPSIELHGVGFRYSEGEPMVVRDCSFAVAPGETLALVGASGCGKTTLLKLMLGLLPPTEGRIKLGGAWMTSLDAGSIHGFTAAVMQDDHLFAGSIADNIASFEPGATLENVAAAAKLAGIYEEIMEMPMGFNSLIGDMGTTLSGGQKQRIVLARALFRKPRILFLDEATSHLDVACERLVNLNIKDLRMTTVLIAHRPETIALADRVITMVDGRIVGRDVPSEPLAGRRTVDAMLG